MTAPTTTDTLPATMIDPEREREYVGAEEAAALLGVTVTAARRMADRGRLPGVKLGREWRFRRADLQALLDAQREHVGAEGAAAILGLSVKAVRRLAATGRLPGTKVEGAWRFRVADLRALPPTPGD